MTESVMVREEAFSGEVKKHPRHLSERPVDVKRLARGGEKPRTSSYKRFFYPPGFVPRHRAEDPVGSASSVEDVGGSFPTGVEIPRPHDESVPFSEQATQPQRVQTVDVSFSRPHPARHAARPVSRLERAATAVTSAAAAGLTALGIRKAMRSGEVKESPVAKGESRASTSPKTEELSLFHSAN